MWVFLDVLCYYFIFVISFFLCFFIIYILLIVITQIVPRMSYIKTNKQHTSFAGELCT